MLSNNQRQRVITYMPQSQLQQGEVIPTAAAPANTRIIEQTAAIEQPTPGMGKLGRGLWVYTHQLGLNFTLVLLLALCYQGFMAVLIGLHGMVTLPPFVGMTTSDNTVVKVLGNVLAVLAAGVIQALLIAEMAQVVWLRRPDKLKVRLMSGSIWWWVMLVALTLTVGIDFLLLFLSITSQDNLVAAWQVVVRNQLVGLTNLMLAVINLLTILRCASVMRTSTSAEIRRDVEEHLEGIANEMLLDAGESAKRKAMKVWDNLSINPLDLLPLQNSVFQSVRAQHPDLFPAELQRVRGGHWGYDLESNTFAALPADVHGALLRNRQRVSEQFGSNLNNMSSGGGGRSRAASKAWGLSPADQAEMIGYKLQENGDPNFVNATQPDAVRYLSAPLDFDDLRAFEERNGNGNGNGNGNKAATRVGEESGYQGQPGVSRVGASAAGSGVAAAGGQFEVQTLPPLEQAMFATYLTNTVYPSVSGSAFPTNTNINIFSVFGAEDLDYYYRTWKRNGQNASAPVLNVGG